MHAVEVAWTAGIVVVAAAGNVDRFSFFRLSAKTFQAVPLVESGFDAGGRAAGPAAGRVRLVRATRAWPERPGRRPGAEPMRERLRERGPSGPAEGQERRP